MANFDTLVGRTITAISGLDRGSERVQFDTADGKTFFMYHRQDCCESVDIEDFSGEPDDLIGSPVLFAEESSSNIAPGARTRSDDYDHEWTFYRIGTVKGTVVIRWYGTSNGYYSMSVSFAEKDVDDY